MAAVEEGGQSTTCWQGFDKDIMHFLFIRARTWEGGYIIDNHSGGFEVFGKDGFIQSVFFVTIQIFSLRPVTRVVKE